MPEINKGRMPPKIQPAMEVGSGGGGVTCVHVCMCTCVHMYMCTCVHGYMCTCVHVLTV
jgi:hypothetical protein